jgi:hypothetical protein
MKKFLTYRVQALAGLALLSIFFTGCAHYQYVIVQPPNVGQPLTKQPIRVDLAPLSYQFFAKDEHVFMEINNPTEGPISLLGPKSYLVDPQGRSHPLRGGIIAPHSFIGMSLPPKEPPGGGLRPSMGVGLGFGGPHFSSGLGFHSGMAFYEDPFFYEPSEPGASSHFWEWKTGQVRMLLYYQQWNPTNTFEHQFVIERRKVK